MDLENNTVDKSFFGKLGQSLLTALLTVLYFVFVLPWKLWTFAIDGLGHQSAGKTFSDSLKTDLPLLNSYITLSNAIIVVSPLAVLIFSFIIMPMIFGGFYMSFGGFLSILITAYYSPILATLVKELMYLSVSIANNIKKIADSK